MKIGAFAEFEHAHHLELSPGNRYPARRPGAPGSGLWFETWATDYRFELGPLWLPRPAHSVVTNGAVQAFEHGVLPKTGSPRGWAVWGRITRLMPPSAPSKAPSAGRSGPRKPSQAPTTFVSASKPGRWCGHRLVWPSSSTSSSSDRETPIMSILDPARRAYVHTLTIAVVGVLSAVTIISGSLAPLIPAAVLAVFDLGVALTHRDVLDWPGKVSAAIYGVAPGSAADQARVRLGYRRAVGHRPATLSAILGGGLAAARAPQPGAVFAPSSEPERYGY